MDDLTENPTLNKLESLLIHSGRYLEETRASKLDWGVLEEVSEYFFQLLNAISSKFEVDEDDGARFKETITKLYDLIEAVNILKTEKELKSISSTVKNTGTALIWLSKTIKSFTKKTSTFILINQFFSNL